MKPVVFGMTDLGRRRDSNEDQYLVDPVHGLYAVADGMGGHAAGEIASMLAIDTLKESMGLGDPAGRPTDAAEAVEHLRRAVAEANRRICESIVTNEEHRGMGTTLVALLHIDDLAIIGNVGDSRAYLLRDGRLHRLTSDHSWVNEQVKMGLLSDDAAQRHPMRNIVTRALGSRVDVTVDLVEENMQPGDTFMLCSDGLNTMLSHEEIESTLKRCAADPEGACRALVEAANAQGGEDNTTVIVLTYPRSASRGTVRQPSP